MKKAQTFREQIQHISRRCDGCAHYDEGICRHSPPTLVRQPDGHWGRVFVPVQRIDWCSQFKQKPDH